METQALESTNTPVSEVIKENSSRTELIKRKEVKDAPFTIISTDGKNFGVMGGYRITESYDKIEDVEEELNKMTWNRIVQVMMILNEMKEETNKELKKELKK